jgi:hypothetical protein
MVGSYNHYVACQEQNKKKIPEKSKRKAQDVNYS